MGGIDFQRRPSCSLSSVSSDVGRWLRAVLALTLMTSVSWLYGAPSMFVKDVTEGLINFHPSLTIHAVIIELNMYSFLDKPAPLDTLLVENLGIPIDTVTCVSHMFSDTRIQGVALLCGSPVFFYSHTKLPSSLAYVRSITVPTINFLDHS